VIEAANFKSFTNVTAFYDPATKENLYIFGLDYKPTASLHLMPNVVAYSYQSSLAQNATNDAYSLNINGIKGTDVMWRLTVWYAYGK
jgi:hypothetical protein